MSENVYTQNMMDKEVPPNFYHYKNELRRYVKNNNLSEFRYRDLPLHLQVRSHFKKAANRDIIRKKRRVWGDTGGIRQIWTLGV